MCFLMKSTLIISIILHMSVSSVMSSSEVKRSNSTYHCCDQIASFVSFDPGCDHEWYHNDTFFALYKNQGLQKEFVQPCGGFKEGVMLLQRCVDIEDRKVCKTPGGRVEEERIDVENLPCSGSLSAPGSVTPLLLLPLLAAVVWLNE